MSFQSPTQDERVRLRYETAGLPAGTEGVLLDSYAEDSWEALVRFGDIDTARVPADALERVSEGAAPGR